MGFRSPFAEEILGYLAKHPKAQDTLEGIVQWWLMEQLMEINKPAVEASVVELVEQGYLLVENKGARSFYKINPNQQLHLAPSAKKENPASGRK